MEQKDVGIGGFGVVLALLALAALFMVAPTKAGEVKTGFGLNCGKLVGDGYWTQEGLPYDMDRCGESVILQYVGKTRIKWLDYSVGAFYRRGPTVSGEYVSDECYGARQFSGGAPVVIGGVTMGACDRRYHAKEVFDKSHGLTFTFNPTWKINRDFSTSLGVGASLFHATTKVAWDHTKGVCALTNCDDGIWKKTGLSPYMEVTAKYGNVFVTAYRADMERSADAAGSSNGNEGLVAGYTFKF